MSSAARMRRLRERRYEGAWIQPIEITAAVKRNLIRLGLLRGIDANDRSEVEEAVRRLLAGDASPGNFVAPRQCEIPTAGTRTPQAAAPNREDSR